MSLNLNNVVLAGHLTRDPELKQIGADKVVANTGIAINRRWKDSSGNQHEEVTFIDVECWGRTAELLGQYLKKGSPAYLEGRLRLDTWDDKESGQKRTRLKVVAETVQFLGMRPAGEGERRQPSPTAASAPAPRRRAAVAAAPVAEGDPPF